MQPTDFLIKEQATIREIFIIDELQKYMDFQKTNDGELKIFWNEPVRLRLQEKKDWKESVRTELNKSLDYHQQQVDNMAQLNQLTLMHYHNSIIDFINNELKERLRL